MCQREIRSLNWELLAEPYFRRQVGRSFKKSHLDIFKLGEYCVVLWRQAQHAVLVIDDALDPKNGRRNLPIRFFYLVTKQTVEQKSAAQILKTYLGSSLPSRQTVDAATVALVALNHA